MSVSLRWYRVEVIWPAHLARVTLYQAPNLVALGAISDRQVHWAHVGGDRWEGRLATSRRMVARVADVTHSEQLGELQARIPCVAWAGGHQAPMGEP